jgi:hypothetical protein
VRRRGRARLALIQQTLGDECIQMPAHPGGRQAEARSEGLSRLWAALEDEPGDGIARAVERANWQLG